MTRKDYVALAEAINKARRKVSGGVPIGLVSDLAIETVENSIADDLASDNPRFDREWFLQACRMVQS